MIIQKKIDLFYWNNPLIALRDKVEVFVFDEYYENSSYIFERFYRYFSFDGNGVANYPFRIKRMKPPQIMNHIKQKENVIHLNFEWKENYSIEIHNSLLSATQSTLPLMTSYQDHLSLKMRN